MPQAQQHAAMPQPPPLPRQQQPQQHAPAPPPAQVAAPAAFPGGQLSIWYQNQPTVVNKDRFIIGRGKQSSDLTIKDPNVSRQHAMVEFVNGQYYMVDMGSTNGIEYNGQRIARKAVQEGDVFRICDHELRFTYR
jgi:pSer/pThr/pTyr-binding forkhead associated (FHA) protein